MKKRKLGILIILLLVLGIAVPETVQPVTVEAAARLATKKKTIVVGKTYTLKLKGNRKKVKWSVSNKNIQIKKRTNTYVSILAKKKGKSTVTATIGRRKYKCVFTVKEAPRINKTRLNLRYKKSYTLSVSGVSSRPRWSVSNRKVVSLKRISAYKYRITGLKKGAAVLTCKAAGKTLRCRINVTESPRLNKTALTLNPGKTSSLSVSGTGSTPTWSTSNKNIVSIKKINRTTCQVKAGKAGSAIVSCKVSGKTLRCRITVKKIQKPAPQPKPDNDWKWTEVSRITLTCSHPVIDNPMDEPTMYARVEPQNATNKLLSWTSSNPKVATVSPKGSQGTYEQEARITVNSEGSAIITATSVDNPKIKASYKLVVDYPEEKPKEPSAELKAALDEITSRDYTMNARDPRPFIKDSRFYFWTQKDDYLMPDAENVCIVTSSNPFIWAESSESDNHISLDHAIGGDGDNGYGTATLTFTLGSYVRTCKLTVFKDPGVQWDEISVNEIASSTKDRKDSAQEIFRLINDFRVKNGRQPLEWEERILLRQSAIQAGFNVNAAIRIESDDPSFLVTAIPSRLAMHGVGQIGVGSVGDLDPEEAFNAWINSPMHQANILEKDAKTIGIAYFSYDWTDEIHNRAGTSVICSFGAEPEYLQGFSESVIKQEIMKGLSSSLKTENDYYTYMNLFYHPSNTYGAVPNTNKNLNSNTKQPDFNDGTFHVR